MMKAVTRMLAAAILAVLVPACNHGKDDITILLPQVPGGVVTVIANQTVQVSWTAAPGAATYRVSRGLAAGGPFTQIAVVGGTVYVDTGLVNNVTYFYIITGLNALTEGTPSAPPAAGTPAAVAPPVVTGLTATPGDTEVTLAWAASLSATNYDIQAGTMGGPYVSVANTAGLTFTHTGLTNSVEICYVVIASNAIGSAAASAEACATPGPPPAPTNFAVAPGAGGGVDTSWTLEPLATSYNVYRSEGVDLGFGTATVGGVTFPGNEVVYESRAPSGSGDGITINHVATPGTPFLTVVDDLGTSTVTVNLRTNLAGSSLSTALEVSSAVNNLVTGSTLVRVVAIGGGIGVNAEAGTAVTAGGAAATIYTLLAAGAGVAGPAFNDGTAAGATLYSYVVTGLNAVGEGQPSNDDFLTTP